MQFTETFSFGGKAPDVIVTQYETGRFFGKKHCHVIDVLFEIGIQGAVTGEFSVNRDHADPGLNGTGFQISRGEVPGTVPQHCLKKNSQTGTAAGKMGFEFPVTVKHTVDFFHGRETAGTQSERVEHIPVAGPLHIFDGLLSEFFFFAGRVGEYVEEIEFLIKCVFSHDMIPFIRGDFKSHSKNDKDAIRKEL